MVIWNKTKESLLRGCYQRTKHDLSTGRNMNRDRSKFLSISFKQEGHVTYGDNNKGRVLGRGSIGDKDILVIHDVLYVEVLKHNLVSISQLCDKGYC